MNLLFGHRAKLYTSWRHKEFVQVTSVKVV